MTKVLSNREQPNLCSIGGKAIINKQDKLLKNKVT